MLTPLLGGVLGTILFLATLGPAIVRPTNLGWLMRHDTQTYLLAWHHFRREPWQWPPGRLLGVGYPVSTSIGNTDAIPLVAFPLKPLHALLPDPFQYLGGWLLACFILQGVFGALLVQRVTNDRVLQVLGAGLFVQAPPLLFRVGHTALCGHWLLLAAIWVCLSHTRSRRWRLTAWTVVCGAAAATHPYLAVMVLGLATADFSSDVLGPRAPWRGLPNAAAGVALAIATMAAVFWVSGIFLVGASDMASEGLGFYSMNLLAPIINQGTSVLLPDLPTATAGQFEGMMYFGAGWLALCALAVGLVATRRAALPRLRLAWVAVAVFLLYAVAPVVTFGSRVLVDLSAWTPDFLSVFRASGRFGWLGMYVAFVTALAAVAAALPRRAARAMVAVALVLQTVDLSRMYAGVRSREHSPAWTEWDDPLKHEVWNLALPYYRHLVLMPPGGCNPDVPGPYLPFSLRAGSFGVTINSGNAARYDAGALRRYCAALDADVRAGRVADDSLYVLSPKMRQVLAAVTQTPMACGTFDGFAMCVTEASTGPWLEVAADQGVVLSPLAARP